MNYLSQHLFMYLFFSSSHFIHLFVVHLFLFLYFFIIIIHKHSHTHSLTHSHAPSQLSNNRESTDNEESKIPELENLLSDKQMEIDILNMLDKHHSKLATVPKPIEPDRLARYILSLSSLCKDPHRFYGYDLVQILQHHDSSTSQDDEFALGVLAACSSATHVRKRQIRRLLDIASGEITNVGK